MAEAFLLNKNNKKIIVTRKPEPFNNNIKDKKEI